MRECMLLMFMFVGDGMRIKSQDCIYVSRSFVKKKYKGTSYVHESVYDVLVSEFRLLCLLHLHVLYCLTWQLYIWEGMVAAVYEMVDLDRSGICLMHG